MDHFTITGTIDNHVVFCLDIVPNIYTNRWNVIQHGKGIVLWSEDGTTVNNYIDAAVASMAQVFEFLNGRGHVCVLNNVGAHVHDTNKKGGYNEDAQ